MCVRVSVLALHLAGDGTDTITAFCVVVVLCFGKRQDRRGEGKDWYRFETGMGSCFSTYMCYCRQV